MTQLGGMVSSEPFTAGMSVIDYHYFILISLSDLGMCNLCDILKKMECQKGSILSVTLFAITINLMVNTVVPSVATSLYVDDIAIYYSSQSTVTIERRIQGAINRLS
jgi:hypothetical protein